MENLGIALGAAARQFNVQDELGMRQQAMDLQKAQNARAEKQFEWQSADRDYSLNKRSQADEIMAEAQRVEGLYGQLNGVGDADLPAWAEKNLAEYYNNHPTYADGKHARITSFNGQPVAVIGSLSRNDVQMMPLTREHAAQALEQMRGSVRSRLAALDPASYGQYLNGERTYGLETRKVANAEKQTTQQGDYQQGKLKIDRDQLEQALKIANAQQSGANYRAGLAHQLNPLQQLQLEQLQGFNRDRDAIYGQLSRGEITEDAARQQLNIAGMKYGGRIPEPAAARNDPMVAKRAEALAALGPQPAPIAGMFGGETDQSKRSREAWAANYNYINSIYGGGQAPTGPKIIQMAEDPIAAARGAAQTQPASAIATATEPQPRRGLTRDQRRDTRLGAAVNGESGETVPEYLRDILGLGVRPTR